MLIGCSDSTSTSQARTESTVSATDLEIDRAMVECLRQAGYNARLASEEDPNVDRGVLWDSPDEQAAEARAVYESCEERLIEEGILPSREPPTDAQLSEMYDEQVAIRECLEGQGYRTSQPPSREAYVQSDGDWLVYLELAELDKDEWDRINKLCPQE